LADVTLPSLGESVTEGIITQWFKKVGDTVARDEPLFEVSTDKVDSEMPSPAAGVLTQILAEEGDTVETGSRVAVIEESGAAPPSASDSDEPRQESVAPVATPSPPSIVAPLADAVNGVVVSPVVRRILADGGVEPSTISGSGPGGSITRRDAERAVLDGPTEEMVVALSNGRRRMDNTWPSQPGHSARLRCHRGRRCGLRQARRARSFDSRWCRHQRRDARESGRGSRTRGVRIPERHVRG